MLQRPLSRFCCLTAGLTFCRTRYAHEQHTTTYNMVILYLVATYVYIWQVNPKRTNRPGLSATMRGRGRGRGRGMFYPRGGGGFFFPMFMPVRGRGRPMRYGLRSVVVTCNLYNLIFRTAMVSQYATLYALVNLCFMFV